MELQIIPTDLLDEYSKQVPDTLKVLFEALHNAEISTDSFNFYISVSAMASSKIEGEPMEIDSYIKHKMLNIEYNKDLIEKPDDLYKAYLFAQNNPLTKTNFLQSHTIIANHLLPKHNQGVCRKGNMVVMEHNTFRIQYEAASADVVEQLISILWKDIATLLKATLSIKEVFFYASFIHIVFVNIHPFEDGNGRAARLLEKWFIAEVLGDKAWFIQSELYYYQNINGYYQNLNRLGMFYEQLDYSKALPLLLMLPSSLVV